MASADETAEPAMILSCPYLAAEVELTDERRQHILDKHPDLLPDHMHRVAETLADPDTVRRDARFPETRLFSRYYDEGTDGKHVVVVVVSSASPDRRHWVVTAYLARRVRQGGIEWKRT